MDKTGLIRELMESGAKVTVFTRPRRFGKSPNMSMIANFFSVEGDKSIFDGPEISKDAELCEKYTGKYPVIFLSMKETDSVNYDGTLKKIAAPINETARKFAFWEHSEKTDEYDKEAYRELRNYEEIKDWYDGYKFGNINVYCPRDVINQCRFL